MYSFFLVTLWVAQEGHSDVVKSVDFSTCGQMVRGPRWDDQKMIRSRSNARLIGRLKKIRGFHSVLFWHEENMRQFFWVDDENWWSTMGVLGTLVNMVNDRCRLFFKPPIEGGIYGTSPSKQWDRSRWGIQARQGRIAWPLDLLSLSLPSRDLT